MTARHLVRSRQLRGLAGRAVLLGVTASVAVPGAVSAAEPSVLDARARVAPAATFDRLETDLNQDRAARSRVIVGLRLRVDPADLARAGGSPSVKREVAAATKAVLLALGRTDHRVVSTYEQLPYVSLDLSAAALARLEESKLAASVHVDQALQPQLSTSTTTIGSDQQVLRGWSGTGQVVAVIDDGVRSAHPFLAGRVLDGACFDSLTSLCGAGATSAFGAGVAEPPSFAGPTAYTHGTAVAGIVAGKREPGGTFDGVAPGAQVLPVRVGQIDDVLNALQYVLTRSDSTQPGSLPVAAVNMSLGNANDLRTECDDSPLKVAVDALRTRGIPTIVSAGNQNQSDALIYPACITTAVAVGNVYNLPGNPSLHDKVAGDSNSAEELDLLAPGEGVVSAWSTTGYQAFGGTSAAAPHVSGAWAAYLHRYPGTSVTDVLAAFRGSGKSITDTFSSTAYTTPRLDLAAAIGRWGFAVATSSTAATQTPSSAFQANSAGGTNVITRSGTGQYLVKFPGLGSGDRGSVQVRETGLSVRRCRVTSLNGSAGATVEVGVKCTNASGALADSTFAAQYQVNEVKRPGTKGGYLSAVQGGSHTPDADLQANSTGGVANTVTKISTGRYTATFPGFAGSRGVPHVTALYVVGNTCQVVSWTASAVEVACRNAAGTLSDSMFSVTYGADAVFTGRRGAYVYAHNATATAPYVPSGAVSWNSQGATNSVSRVSTGRYEVTLGGQSGLSALPLVTAVDGSSLRACRPVGWGDSGAGGATVEVQCTNASGALADAKFVLSYSTSVALS